MVMPPSTPIPQPVQVRDLAVLILAIWICPISLPISSEADSPEEEGMDGVEICRKRETISVLVFESLLMTPLRV